MEIVCTIEEYNKLMQYCLIKYFGLFCFFFFFLIKKCIELANLMTILERVENSLEVIKRHNVRVGSLNQEARMTSS